MAVPFGSIIQIYGIHDYHCVEYSTTFGPGYQVIEWDARPADNWKLYITDQNSNILQTVDIGTLTEEDINEEKAKNCGVFASIFELPASLCPNSTSVSLQIYIESKNNLMITKYKSNTVSIKLNIPSGVPEFYPSWCQLVNDAGEPIINPKHTVTNLVLGEEGQRFLLAGESTFTSTGYYTPGIGAGRGSVAASVLIGVNEDFQYENSNDIWITPIKDTTLGQDDVYMYEYRYNLNEPNTYRFEFFVFDARGRWGPQAATATSIVKVWEYSRPSVDLTIQRTIGAATPSITCKYKCTHSELGAEGNKLKQLHIERKDLNTENSDWVEWESINVSTNSSGEISLAMGSSDDPSYASHEWAFRGWVDDTIMQSKYPTDAERRSHSAMSKVSQIQSEFRVFNVHKDGKGLAIGKIATEVDKLDVNLPTIFRKGISFDDCTMPAKFSKGVVIGNTSYIQTEPDTKTLNNLVYPLCLHNSENLFACSVVGGQYGRNSSQSKFGDTCLTIFGAEDNEKVVIKFKMGGTWIKPVIDKTHIYYTCLWAKQEQSNGYLDVYWEAGDNEPIISHMAVPTSGEWAKMSGRFNRQSEAIGDGAQYYRLEYHNGNVADKMWIDGVVLYDLTAAFGAGKEPSKSWCDAHLDYTDESVSVLDPNFSIKPELISEVPTTVRYTKMSDGPTVMRTKTSSAPMIKFQNLDADGNEQTLGYIGHSVAPNQKIRRWSADGSEVYDLLDTGYVVDYIVEQGEAGKWKYEKWNSGKMECWGTFGTSSLRTSTQWGTLYTGTWMNSDTNKNARQYPVPFVEEPTVSATLTVPNGANGWLMTNFENNIGTLSTHAPAYQVVRTTDATIDNPRIHYHVVGKWKNN